MNHPTDSERLLDDVLSGAMPADFREALLDETLRLAGRRRRRRQAGRASAWLVVLGLLAGLVWQNRPHSPAGPSLVAKAGDQGCRVVETEPLFAGDVVATQPLAAGQLVASVRTVGVVETALNRDGFRVIDDDELLKLASSRPAALVRLGPHSKQLVFANPDDERGFPVN